jgi:hypothetical protein
MNAKVAIETITPAIAKRYLENRFEGQRSVRNGHVHRLAQDINDGKWLLTSDAITLIKGKLANGQHRCEAIALADVACDALVLRTEDETLFSVLDSGIGRQARDVLTQYGFEAGSVLAAAARCVLAYRKGLISRRGISNTMKRTGSEIRVTITRQEIIEYTQENAQSMQENWETVRKLYAKAPYISKPWAVAFLEIARPIHGSKAVAYITSLYRGGDPKTAALRERLIQNRMGKNRMNQEYTFGIIIKGFHVYRSDAEIGILKIGEVEEFPKI